jgi:uncharacterized integral membrane protein
MRQLTWIVKLGIFLLLLWFALKNTTPVPVHFSAQTSWDGVPLIVVMVACMAIGALLGALALALPIYRVRRELARLRRQSASSPADNSDDSLAAAARGSGAVVDLETGTGR